LSAFKCAESAEIATTINPVVENAGLKVYPNPFSNRLRFGFVYPASVNARIDLYDMTGRLVKTIMSPLRKVKKKKMPRNLKSTKTHKIFIIRSIHFSVIWCFGVLVAIKDFSE
jgi:hypothetical protein